MASINPESTLGTRLGGVLAKTNLREQALHAMRNALTSGEIEPGTHLVETELSAALSISRGTLREALRQLQQEGLVEMSERGRLRVRTLSRVEIEDMFAVRSALEGLAAATLARLPERQAVTEALQAALDALAAATGSIHDMVEIDLEFHRTLCRLTGNSALLHSWEGLAGSIRMSIMFAGADRAVTNMSVPRHQTLVDAIASGDPERARVAVEEHMQGAAANLVGEVVAPGDDLAS